MFPLVRCLVSHYLMLTTHPVHVWFKLFVSSLNWVKLSPTIFFPLSTHLLHWIYLSLVSLNLHPELHVLFHCLIILKPYRLDFTLIFLEGFISFYLNEFFKRSFIFWFSFELYIRLLADYQALPTEFFLILVHLLFKLRYLPLESVLLIFNIR